MALPDQVSVALPEAGPAAAEAAELVAGAVGPVPGAPGPRWRQPAPLEAAALLVPEDLVVLLHRHGTWCLAAAVVCFPSHWSPATKLGLPIAAVHGPVPRYRSELSERVDRFLDHLSTDRPVWRRNWTVHASSELYAPKPVAARGPVAPGEHWLRSERQTLSALPRTGGILFTVLTQQVPLAMVADRPDIASALARALRAMPAELAAYRFGGLDLGGILGWLEDMGPGRPGRPGPPGD